jgi:hypothetical protein
MAVYVKNIWMVVICYRCCENIKFSVQKKNALTEAHSLSRIEVSKIIADVQLSCSISGPGKFTINYMRSNRCFEVVTLNYPLKNAIFIRSLNIYVLFIRGQTLFMSLGYYDRADVSRLNNGDGRDADRLLNTKIFRNAFHICVEIHGAPEAAVVGHYTSHAKGDSDFKVLSNALLLAKPCTLACCSGLRQQCHLQSYKCAAHCAESTMKHK